MEKFRGSTKKNRVLQNSRGQFALEAVLLTTVLIGTFLVISNYLKKEQILTKLMYPKGNSVSVVEKLNVMVGFGTWQTNGCMAPGKPRQTLGKCHPNSIQRSLSSDPGI